MDSHNHDHITVRSDLYAVIKRVCQDYSLTQDMAVREAFKVKFPREAFDL